MTSARGAKQVRAERAAVAGLVERVLAAKQPSHEASARPGPAVEVAALACRAEAIAQAEAEIDERVYRLYELTKEEVKLVEESVKR